MDKLKVSIVTPILNAANFIEKCLLSVAGQTHQCKEHLIVDGASTDGTLEIVKEYAAKYPHIKFISEKDDGIYDAMNKGIDLAKGEWLYFLGADDVLHNDMVLEEIFSSIDENLVDVVYGNVLWGNTGLLFDGRYSLLKLMDHNICHQAIFYKRTVFNLLGKFDTTYATWADWLFNIRSFTSDFIRTQYVPTVVADFSFGGHSTKVGEDLTFLRDKNDIFSEYFPEDFIQVKKRLGDNEIHLSELEKSLLIRNQQLAEQKQQLGDQEQHLAKQKSELAELNLLSKILQQTLRERDADIVQLHSSFSWRITFPLRLLGQQILKAINFTKTCLKIVEQTGGVGASIAKISAIIRDEGLHGIKKSFLQNISSSHAPELQHDIDPFRNPKTTICYNPTRGYWIASGPPAYAYIPPCQPANLEQILSGLRNAPLFSILVPVYNTPPELLEKLIKSVTSQWYTNWQLILADDASTSVPTKTALEGLDDCRILVIELLTNQGIAGATNTALAAATGEFVVLLDHDDELTEDCLFELALCINRENPDFIYSDEDKVTPEGIFTEPHFKPDWSPDTMMSTMYVCHVSCVRRSLLMDIGGLQSKYDGCQDWDLALRLVEKTKSISHIPKVLYHWRIIPGSVAGDIAAKSYVLDASRRVREDALKRRGLKGSVEAVEQVRGYFRVNYHLLDDPLISIIIPTRDNDNVLLRCVNSIIEKSSYRNFELLLLDNGSVLPETIACFEQLAQKEQVKIIRHDAPFNFSELNNIGIRNASGEILLFLNDDTEVITADWLERMGGYAQLAHVGAVGAKLLYPGECQIQHAGVMNLEDGPVHAFRGQDKNSPGYFMRNLLEYNWLAVTGACLMIERAKFELIGGFDESFPVAYNDIDLCLRLRTLGLYNVVCLAVQLTHHESISRGQDHLDTVKKERLNRDKCHLFDKHPHYFQFDPFYNPNLHPNGNNFEYDL